jgi:serine/threonine protein kinase
METLLAATENFHDDNKLGQGGFGPVYKGTLSDGKEIAVKKLCLKSRQGKKEFINEVKLVSKIQHRNLVKLLGCCTEGLEKLLVYEYLPNKSLDKILFDPEKRNQLDWQKRYNIIVGIARGLLYLHQDSRLRIIHRDIKASNILLDEKLDPKVADFGLARVFPEDESHVSTTVAGTYGYMAPEYLMQRQLSVKADVYSFGVLLLEVVTGRKNTDYNLSPEMQMLLEWAWRSYEHGNIEQMIDRAIIETCDEEQALRCIVVGLLCTQADSSLRPPMSTITLMISSHSVTLPDPTKPAFVSSVTQTTSSGSGLSHASVTAHSSVSSASSHILSNADASITELVPR